MFFNTNDKEIFAEEDFEVDGIEDNLGQHFESSTHEDVNKASNFNEERLLTFVTKIPSLRCTVIL